MSSIVARQHRLYVGQSPFAHNFLALHDDDGNLVEEFHGEPVDAESNVLPKGRSSESLRFNKYPEPRHDHVAEQTVWQGPHNEALIKWKAAKEAGDQINSRDLSYSPLGGDFETPREPDAPRRPVIAGNSNSVFRTLLDAMKLPLPSLPIMAPGTENPLLTKDDLNPPKQKGGLSRPTLPNAGLLSPNLPKAGLLSPSQPTDGLLAPSKQGLLGPIY